MSPRERMIAAIKNEVPDRVPVAPDISMMVPARRTGRPWFDIFVHQNPSIWRAYLDAVDYFGFDGWFIYGDMQFKTPGSTYGSLGAEHKPESSTLAYSRRTDERWVIGYEGELAGHRYTYEWTYYVADSPTFTEKPLKARDLVERWELVEKWYAPPVGCDPSLVRQQRRELGERGAFGLHVIYPGFQTWLFSDFDGGLAPLFYAYYDRHDLIERIRELHERRALREMEMVLDEKPDFVLLGGSGTITIQGPNLTRELTLPTLKKLTRMAKEAGVPTMLHSCGKEMALVEMCANETDLNCINPLEAPPFGDCELAEVKRLYGHRLALSGNLPTATLMLRGSYNDVFEASRQAIEDAGANGGFVLSTGDQCGRDTPDENILAMVDAAKEFGQY